jgi:hypothetical protein
MRYLLALPLLVSATPAWATQGFLCRTVAPEGVTVSVVIGTLGIAGAALRDGERTFSSFGTGAVLGQHWVDERALMLDLLSEDQTERIARLRVGMSGPLESRTLTGRLEYAGRRWRTVCAPD